MRRRPYRLLSIAHSYCVALNRRLANEIARAGGADWEVTAVAPSFFHGDLRDIAAEDYPGELCRLETVRTFLSRHIHFFFYASRLREILARDWDLVHCWEEPYIVAGAQVAWWTPSHTPLVFWTGQSTFKRYPPPFTQIERYCLRRCAGWMARGEAAVGTLLRRGYGIKPHRVMPLGVDLRSVPAQLLRPRRCSCAPWLERRGAAGGRLPRPLRRGKGPRPTNAHAQSGEGALARTSGRRWSARTGHPRMGRTVPRPRPHRHGRAPDGVPAYLNAMDFLCAPSRTTARWREIFGRMIIEAFACGIPVLASDCGEIPNVVRDAGVVIGENDAPGWLAAIDRLLEDSSLRAELAQRGLERARSEYAWPVIARRHLDFFTELLERAPGANAA